MGLGAYIWILFPVLSPEKVSRMEHVLPMWTTSWGSKSAKQMHMQVHFGVRVSSFNHQELWVFKIHLAYELHIKVSLDVGVHLPSRTMCCLKSSDVLLVLLQQLLWEGTSIIGSLDFYISKHLPFKEDHGVTLNMLRTETALSWLL